MGTFLDGILKHTSGRPGDTVEESYRREVEGVRPTDSSPDVKPCRRMTLRVGSAFLPLVFGPDEHRYEVVSDPLPLDAVVIGCSMAPDLRSFILVLESSEFAPVANGSTYPEITPVFRSIPAPRV